jgi:hypothetical protein
MRIENVLTSSINVEETEQEKVTKNVSKDKEEREMANVVDFEEIDTMFSEEELDEDYYEEEEKPKSLIVFDLGKVGASIIDAYEKKYSLNNQESLEKVKAVYEAHYLDITGRSFEAELGINEGDEVYEEDLEELQDSALCDLACKLYAHVDWEYWRSLISDLEIADALLDYAFLGFANY